MASFNKVLLLGNLTRDPQMKYLPSQTPVCEFGLAANRRFKTQGGEEREEVLFVDCSAFGRQAEVINQWMTKGKPLFVEGRLKFDSWEDKQGGGKRSKLTVVVEQFQFVGTRDGEAGADAGQDAGQGDERPAPVARQPQRRAQPAGNDQRRPHPTDGERKMFAEADIPF